MAQIDPSIPLSTRGLGPMRSFTETMQQAESLRLQREQSEALAEQRRAMAEQRQQQIAAAREASIQAAKLRTLTAWTPETVFPIVGPEKGADILKGLSALKEQDLKTEGAQRAMLGSVIGGLKALPAPMQPEAYRAIRESLISRGTFKADDIPEQFSPQYLDAAQQWAMSAEQQRTDARATASDARAAETHAAQLPGMQADTTIKTQVAAGTVGGLTPEQQRADARARGTAAETARHNRAMEANATRASEPLEAVMKDGKSVLVPRSQAVGLTPATSRERTTEDERKSVGWYQQMRDAAATIDALEDKLTEKELYQIQTLPHEQLIGMANRNMLSEHAKRYFRAFTQFSEARLRSVSGAAISTGEYQSDRQTYGKQYGETSTLAQDRKRAREVVIQATKDRAGVAMPKDAAGGDVIYARDPQGQIHSAKAGTALPAGWVQVQKGGT